MKKASLQVNLIAIRMGIRRRRVASASAGPGPPAGPASHGALAAAGSEPSRLTVPAPAPAGRSTVDFKLNLKITASMLGGPGRGVRIADRPGALGAHPGWRAYY